MEKKLYILAHTEFEECISNSAGETYHLVLNPTAADCMILYPTDDIDNETLHFAPTSSSARETMHNETLTKKHFSFHF